MRPPLFSYPPESSFNTTLLPLPHITLSVTHRASFSVQMVCSLLSNSEASPSRHVSFQLFCSISPPSIFLSEKEEFCRSPIRQHLWSSADLCHFFSDQKENCFDTNEPTWKTQKKLYFAVVLCLLEIIKILSSRKCHVTEHISAHCQICVSKAFLGAHISEQAPPRNLVKKFTLPQVPSI